MTDIDQSQVTIGELKALIQSMTNILPERQKILGLAKGTLSDDSLISSLGIKFKDNVFKFTLMGTPETELIQMQTSTDNYLKSAGNEVFNDLSCDFSSSTPEWAKLQEYTNTTSINFIHEPRPNKKLLVLDLDHTILHFTSKEEVTCENMKRPHMDTFLTEVYAHYDIAIWSQTHWKWVEIKLIELGLLSHHGYKICFILDKSSMFNMENGKVKPLHLIWSKYPQHWSKQNTIHVDDLARNFVLNKSSGLLIPPYNRPKTATAGSTQQNGNALSSCSSNSNSSQQFQYQQQNGLLMPLSSFTGAAAAGEPVDDHLVHLSR